MKLFGKKPDAQPPTPVVSASSLNPNTVIYTMPEKFFIADKPPFWSAKKIWAVVIIILAILVGVVVWLAMSIQQPSAPATNTPALDTASSATVLPDTITPIPEVTPVAPAETPTASETPVPAAPLVLPRGADADGDELSDVEERLFGTDPQTSDSDNDGFFDRQELLQGYNPIGTGKVADAGMFSEYRDREGGFTLQHPKSWTVSQDGGVIVLTATDGERMTLTTTLNSSGASLRDWYVVQHPEADAAVVAAETFAGVSGIFSPDRRTFTFLLTDEPTVVFTLNDDVGTKTETNYLTVFELLVRSLKAL